VVWSCARSRSWGDWVTAAARSAAVCSAPNQPVTASQPSRTARSGSDEAVSRDSVVSLPPLSTVVVAVSVCDCCRPRTAVSPLPTAMPPLTVCPPLTVPVSCPSPTSRVTCSLDREVTLTSAVTPSAPTETVPPLDDDCPWVKRVASARTSSTVSAAHTCWYLSA